MDKQTAVKNGGGNEREKKKERKLDVALAGERCAPDGEAKSEPRSKRNKTPVGQQLMLIASRLRYSLSQMLCNTVKDLTWIHQGRHGYIGT